MQVDENSFEYDGTEFSRRLDAFDSPETSGIENERSDIKAHKSELKRYSSNQFLPSVPRRAVVPEESPRRAVILNAVQSKFNEPVPQSPSQYVQNTIDPSTFLLEYSPSPTRSEAVVESSRMDEHQRILDAVLRGGDESTLDLTYDSIDSELEKQHSKARRMQESKLNKVREKIRNEASSSNEFGKGRGRHSGKQAFDTDDDTDLDLVSIDDNSSEFEFQQHRLDDFETRRDVSHHRDVSGSGQGRSLVSRENGMRAHVADRSHSLQSSRRMVDAATLTTETYEHIHALEAALAAETQQKKFIAAKCSALESELAARNSQVEVAQTSLDAASVSHRELEHRLRKRDEEMSVLSVQLDNTRHEVSKLKDAAQKAVEELNESLSKRNQLEADNKELTARTKADQATMRQLIQENETMKKDLFQVRKSMVQLEKENSLIQSSVLDLKQQLASRQTVAEQYRLSDEASKRDLASARHENAKHEEELGNLRDMINNLRIQLREAIQKQKSAESDALRLQTQISANNMDFLRGGSRTTNNSPEKSSFTVGGFNNNPPHAVALPSVDEFVPSEREVELFELMVKYYKKQQQVKKGLAVASPAPAQRPPPISEEPPLRMFDGSQSDNAGVRMSDKSQFRLAPVVSTEGDASLMHSQNEETRPRVSQKVFKLDGRDMHSGEDYPRQSVSHAPSSLVDNSRAPPGNMESSIDKMKREMMNAQLRKSVSHPPQEPGGYAHQGIGDRERLNVQREEELKAAIRSNSPPSRHRYQPSTLVLEDPPQMRVSQQAVPLVPPLKLDQIRPPFGTTVQPHPAAEPRHEVLSDSAPKEKPASAFQSPDSKLTTNQPTDAGLRRGPDNRPFATDGSLQVSLETTAAIENELMSLNILKETREREYEKIVPMASKKIAARKRKQEIEEELDTINKDISKLRMKLRSLDALHNF